MKKLIVLAFYIIALLVLLCPLYFAFTKEPFCLLLFLVSWIPSYIFKTVGDEIDKQF